MITDYDTTAAATSLEVDGVTHSGCFDSDITVLVLGIVRAGAIFEFGYGYVSGYLAHDVIAACAVFALALMAFSVPFTDF